MDEKSEHPLRSVGLFMLPVEEAACLLSINTGYGFEWEEEMLCHAHSVILYWLG